MTSTSSHTAARPTRRLVPAGTTALRLGLLALVAIGIVGAALELAFERHWQTPVQFIPWVALALQVVALVLLAARDSGRALTVVRVLAAIVLVASAYGVFMHVSVNHGMGAMDPEWDSLSPLTQWWYALTKSVGAAPPLAPGMLAQSALVLLLASVTPKRREPVA
jgi:predicted neutral ceramidase superfamily lipid hydrolase